MEQNSRCAEKETGVFGLGRILLMLPHTDWHRIHIISLLLRFTFLCYKIIPTIMVFSTGRGSSENVTDINSLGFITTLWGSQPSYFHSYLTAKETGPEKLSHLLKATEFLSRGSGVAAQACPRVISDHCREAAYFPPATLFPAASPGSQ